MSGSIATTDGYGASPISRRARASRTEMADRHDALVAITRRVQPATVRAVFYQASVLGVVGKDEAGYRRVQRDLVTLRQEGRIPFGWIVDGTRWMRKPRTFDCLADALADTAQFYRRSLWQRADTYLEVWIEKDALAGTIFPVTSEFDVPLMVARGYASLTFLHEAAEAIVAQQRPVSILHLGDYDPSGINAAEKIEETLRTYAPAADITFRRLAVTDEQIQRLNLPSRPTKASDSRAAGWGDRVSVELDAIDPRVLRNLLREEIEAILPEHELAVLREAEASERELLQAIAGQYGRDVEEVGP